MEREQTVCLKKYANRRIYNTETSAYVTLADIADLVRRGRWVSVTDADTGEDVTAFILTQIVMAAARKKNALLPVSLLHLLIRYGETDLTDFFGRYLEKILKSYLAYKHIADEQFNRWLEMGAGLSSGKGAGMSGAENPIQAFFSQLLASAGAKKDRDAKE